MVKLIVFVTLVALTLSVEGFGNKKIPTYFRGDAFPEPKVPPPTPSNIVLDTITQRVDNFDPTNDDTWEQWYYSNDEFYQPGGPLFLFLAGEWDITPYRLTNSLMAQLASELNGTIFYLEHRYYGQSRPVPDTSDANLRFLTVQQALADAAHFVNFITSEEVTPGFDNGPVIVIGGHYSGSLAVWFRQKYPHLTTGAWASSAPLQALVNNQQFKEVAGAAYRFAGGVDCYDTIEAGFAAMEEYMDTGRASELQQIFTTCYPIVSDADRSIFFSIVAELFAIVPQFNHIYSVRQTCDQITNGTAESEVHRIARHTDNLIDEYFGSIIPCIPSSHNAVVAAERITDWDNYINDLGIRPYTYQLCSQLGWIHSSNSRWQPFGTSFNHEWMYVRCLDIFGFNQQTLDENVSRFNTEFGAFDPAVTNTLFVHGELDPYRTLGVQTDLHESSLALVVRGASQGNDLGPITDEDSAQLLAAKLQIIDILTGWIQNA